MSRINRIPLGYLDLVGTETGGKTPSDASEEVSPVVEMEEFYSAITLSSEQFSFNNNVVGDFGQSDVPDGEIWKVYSIGVNELRATALDMSDIAVFFGRLTRSDSAGNFALMFDTGKLINDFATGRASASILLPRPVHLASGSRVLAQVQDRTGTAPLRVTDISLLVAKFEG